MDPNKELEAAMPDLMHATLHAVALLTLHITRKSELPQGEVERLAKLLRRFLEAVPR